MFSAIFEYVKLFRAAAAKKSPRAGNREAPRTVLSLSIHAGEVLRMRLTVVYVLSVWRENMRPNTLRILHAMSLKRAGGVYGALPSPGQGMGLSRHRKSPRFVVWGVISA